jgi:hypothetical protein
MEGRYKMTKDAEMIAFEKGLREQIAKEIEMLLDEGKQSCDDWDTGVINAAAIARGEVIK